MAPELALLPGSDSHLRKFTSTLTRLDKSLTSLYQQRNTTTVPHRTANAMQSHLKPSERKITPPGKLIINSLLTPPDSRAKPSERVKKILHLLKERKSGRILSTAPWQTFK